MNKKKTIVICEDHPIVMNGLQHVLEQIDRYEILALTRRGEHLLHALQKHNPDVILLDLNLPDQDGFSLLEQIRKTNATVEIIIFTTYEDDVLVEKAKKLKANAYLLKNVDDAELINTIDAVETGTFLVSEYIRAKESDKKIFKDKFIGKIKLTNREVDIIREILKGKSASAIAETLFLSPHTIETHRKNIFRKLEVNSTVELVNLVHEKGII